MRRQIHGSAWTDSETAECIRGTWTRHGVVIDPHTAVGLLGLRAFREHQSGAAAESPGVVLSTAHPAKFAETVEPLVEHEIPLPPALAHRLKEERQSHPTHSDRADSAPLGPVHVQPHALHEVDKSRIGSRWIESPVKPHPE
ncbi:MAG: hypothetical protein IH968_13490 [Gemmatimonadetes bacterium]|nr:hypothetical protein [Gemmatimonadota bacterium]